MVRPKNLPSRRGRGGGGGSGGSKGPSKNQGKPSQSASVRRSRGRSQARGVASRSRSRSPSRSRSRSPSRSRSRSPSRSRSRSPPARRRLGPSLSSWGSPRRRSPTDRLQSPSDPQDRHRGRTPPPLQPGPSATAAVSSGARVAPSTSSDASASPCQPMSNRSGQARPAAARPGAARTGASSGASGGSSSSRRRQPPPGSGRAGAARRQPYLGVYAQIRKYQTSTQLLLRRLPFMRVVKDVTGRLGTDVAHWNVTALAALQEAAEAYLVEYFEDVNACAAHAKRVTIMQKDFMLVKKLRRLKDF